jgi:hypothetical protein
MAIKSMRIACVKQMYLKETIRNLYKFLVGTTDMNRSFGRCRRRCEDKSSFKMDLKQAGCEGML